MHPDVLPTEELVSWLRWARANRHKVPPPPPTLKTFVSFKGIPLLPLTQRPSLAWFSPAWLWLPAQDLLVSRQTSVVPCSAVLCCSEVIFEADS